MSRRTGQMYETNKAVFQDWLPMNWRPWFDASRLLYIVYSVHQRQAAVKLYGVFAFRLKVLDCAPVLSVSLVSRRGQ